MPITSALAHLRTRLWTQIFRAGVYKPQTGRLSTKITAPRRGISVLKYDARLNAPQQLEGVVEQLNLIAERRMLWRAFWAAALQ